MENDKTSLSVIMAVYNEAENVGNTIDRVLSQKVKGVDLNLVIVESNSTDGSREIVESYAMHPQVVVRYQEAPMGKGNAIREGFSIAKGEIFLIQDADDEYDVNDYEKLLRPIINKQAVFVLGSRHSDSVMDMRIFDDQPFVANLLNFGHVVFAFLINIFYRVSLKDPFTMYKVFRSECVKGLKFECNRFDFDIELVIKLIKKGYVPIEIPVRYKSRSFSEGKKVRVFFDPLTWVKTIVKYKFYD